MIYIIIGLMLVILILISYISSVKMELRNISKQMEVNKDDYINIRTATNDKDLEEVVTKINYLYDYNQKVKSDTKSKEEELRQSIANMSHDLRTPLTSIMGYMQLMRSNETTEEEKEEYFEVVEKRTKSLQNLISSFYNLSRLQNNEYKFNYKKLSLSTILCDNIALYYNDFVNNNIEPVIEVDENVNNIISDEGAVNRIFSNLIGNMIKHGQGEMKIILKNEGKYILSEFINFAPNLDDNVASKLFDRFYTADKSRSDRNTGLGLSITKAFVEELGNEIDAKLIKNNLCISIKWKI